MQGHEEAGVTVFRDSERMTVDRGFKLLAGDRLLTGPAAKVQVKLADGKERTIQHMMATSFWGPDGKPMSAAEFVKRLFGDLPDLFKNEDELREIWSRPDTRERLLAGLEEKAFLLRELGERVLQAIVNLA